MKKNNRKIGELFEDKACDQLVDMGYEIIARNYRCTFGEIDIIAKDRKYVVFCEVKYRKSSRYGYAYEAVNFAKQQRIRKIAMHYLLQNKWMGVSCRFDIIGFDNEAFSHFKNAF